MEIKNKKVKEVDKSGCGSICFIPKLLARIYFQILV